MPGVAIEHEQDHPDIRTRHARMLRRTAVLMSQRGEAWQTDLTDISATGVKLTRPEHWHGQIGGVWVLDMLFGEDLNVHVTAEVARITAHHVALAFVQIPAEVQQALWNLLGGYADTQEPWDEDTAPR